MARASEQKVRNGFLLSTETVPHEEHSLSFWSCGSGWWFSINFLEGGMSGQVDVNNHNAHVTLLNFTFWLNSVWRINLWTFDAI